MTVNSIIDEDEARALLGYIKTPHLPLDAIRAHVLEHYGLAGDWKPLGGEREQNHMLRTAAGETYVVKVSSPEEDPDGLLFQCEALEHIRRVDPELNVPRVCRTRRGEFLSPISDGKGVSHDLRLLSFLSGKTVSDELRRNGNRLSMADLVSLGETQGRLARALQGFNHRGALRAMPWHIANGLVLGSWLRDYLPEAITKEVEGALAEFERVTLGLLPTLRSQVIHNDFHDSNVLVHYGPGLEVTGVIDFGDMVFGSVAQDLAVSVASLIHWSPDPLAAAASIVSGYQKYVPLERGDLAVLKNLVLVRLILQVGLVRYQTVANGRHDAHLESLQALYIQAITRLVALSDRAFIEALTPAVPSFQVTGPGAYTLQAGILLERRQAVLGKTYMFYNEPLELVRGQGTKVFDKSGREYLDCYNNVPNVGHCHPYVVNALARQAATLNTNSRYLHSEIVRLGERLTATLPEGLDTWIFVCTGSEANDLAVRMARSVTGKNGVIVTEKSYHGNTSVVAPLSLLEYDIADKPNWVATIPAPNPYRGVHRDAGQNMGAFFANHVTTAAAELDSQGQGTAALLLDTIFDANGALNPPSDYVASAFANARRAGALCIADEVQIGFGRSGAHMWGFEAFGVLPDIVTLGKPMGNGHPVAAVVTRREIALEFQKRSGYFNTFGGNTVSAAVANATLDVLQGEQLQANALKVGSYLKSTLAGLARDHALIGDVRGRGLFVGVELVADPASRSPAKYAARWVRERMKAAGVLVSSSGPLGNVIKIRPPLVFSMADADRCISALDEALSAVPSDQRVAS